MASIRERKKRDGSKVFAVQVRQRGFPAITATFPTIRMAQRWAKTKEAEMIEGRHFRSPEARRRTVAEAIDRYTREVLPEKRSKNMHSAALPWWQRQIGHLKLAEVTQATVLEQRGRLMREAFKRAKPESDRSVVKEGEKPNTFKRTPSTANRYVAVLSNLFTLAKQWEWAGHNPAEGLAKLAERSERARVLTTEQRNALIKQTEGDPTLHLFVLVALGTACRAGELLNLEWHDVDADDGRLSFRKTKNEQPRSAWLHGVAKKLISELADGKKPEARVFVNASGKGRRYRYAKPFKQACERAGIPGFVFHNLRHSAATYLARDGASESQIKAIGGWRSNVVGRYIHMAAADTKSVMQKLSEKIDAIAQPVAATK
jgi:integrase